MERILSLTLWLALVGPLVSFAQSPPLSNPSVCNLGLTIPDNTCPNTYTIEVTQTPGLLGQDVFVQEVRLLIAHTWTNDLDITLISPGGVEVVLSSDNGGSGDNYGDPDAPNCSGSTIFSNVGACLPVTAGEAPFLDGPYTPEESLFRFNDGTTSANGNWSLRLCDDAGADVGTLEFVELVFAPLACLPPTDLQVTEADTTAVVLDWTSPSGCATTLIEYGPPGFAPGTDSLPGGGEVVIGGCPPFTLSGLAAETSYEVYVRTYCDGLGFSANACPVLFETGCEPPPLTLRFPFDTLSLCPGLCDRVCAIEGFWTNDEADQQDWLAQDGSGTGPDDDVSGGGRFLLMETTGSCPQNGEARLISNCLLLDKQGTDTCHLSFYYQMAGTTVGSLRLEASDDGGQNWSALWQRNGNQGDGWQKAYIGLGAYADGAVLQLRFVGTKGAGSLGDIALDEIAFYGAQDLGPGAVYFADADGDGFGSAANTIISCNLVPPGFVDNDLDCNDQDSTVFPGAPEIPCDGIDQNCNGMADDSLAPPPLFVADTICSGQEAEVCAQPLNGNFIVWYDSPDSQTPIAFGECYREVLTNTTASPIEQTVYADQIGACPSSARAEVPILILPQPEIAVQDSPAICQGESFDLRTVDVVDLNFTGGQLSFHSAFPPDDLNELPSPFVNPPVSRTYYLQFVSPSGCIDTDSIFLEVRPVPALSFVPADSFSLCLGAEEILTATITNGTGPYQFFWNTGAQTPSITVSAGDVPGGQVNYQLTVSDTLGCSAFGNVQVTTTTAIDSLRRLVFPVSSCGASDGAIILEPLNGLPPFSFSWIEPDGSTRDSTGIADELQLSGLAQGTYRFTITDNSAQACSIILPSVVVNGPAAVLDTFFVEDVSCAGGLDGSIQLVVSGSNPTFQWSSGQSGPVINGLQAGFYSVTISEGGCEIVLDSIQVDQPPPLQVSAQYQLPRCFGEADGAIEVEAAGGVGGYTYNWENGQSFLPVYEDIAAGTYLLRVQDQNACGLDTSFVLDQPEMLSIATDSLASPSCHGFSDGLIATRAQGGTGPYTYSWAHGPATATVVGLVDGNYQLELTDANGCTTDEAFVLAEPDSVRLQAIAVQPPVCTGDSTGMISLEALGGTPPYAFQWNTGDTSAMLSDLPVGLYQAVVTDSRSCPGDSISLPLEAVSSPVDVDLDISLPTCLGLEDGSVAALPVGSGPFQFIWSTGDTSSFISGLGADSIGLRLTDANGCFLDTSVVLMPPQFIDLAVSVVQPSCNGLSDGRITVNVLQGGGPGTTFQWSDGAGTAQRTNLQGGTYTVTVTNSQGCTNTPAPFVLTNPEPVVISLLSQGDVACHGDSTGFASFEVAGGTPPYDLRLNGVTVDTTVFAHLPAGDYQFTALDVNACLDDQMFAIQQPEQLEASIILDALDPCAQIDSITLVADVDGGSPPYTYLWSNGDLGDMLPNAPPGDYGLTVTDARGCLDAAEEVKVSSSFQAFQLDTFAVRPVQCFGNSDGEALVEVSGGSRNYIFHFSNNAIVETSDQQVLLTGLPVDDRFGVTVTDAVTGCVVASADLDITSPPPLITRRDSILQPTCQGGMNGAIYTSTFGGTPPYSWVWTTSSGDTVGTSPDLVDLPESIYQLEVRDANGCLFVMPPVPLQASSQPLQVVDSLTEIQHIACRGDSTGSISIVLEGGTPPYFFDWGNVPANGPQAQNLPAGLYSVLIEDASGCTLVFQDFEVEEPEEALQIDLQVDDISCSGESDGSITAFVDGGTLPYDLAWFKDMVLIQVQDPFLDGLEAGNYLLAAEDSAGCFLAAGATVREPDPLEVDIQQEQSGDSTLLLANVMGGTPPFAFEWTNGDTTQVIFPGFTGVFNVTVTDANQCAVVEGILVTSVADLDLISRLAVYPNPVLDELVVELHTPEVPALEVQLFDATGRLLYRRQARAQTARTLYIPVRPWPAGLYLLRVVSSDGLVMARRRIVKTTR